MNRQVENAAARFVEATVARYGAASALSRARMMTHEYPANRRPQWLTRAIVMLNEKCMQASNEAARKILKEMGP